MVVVVVVVLPDCLLFVCQIRAAACLGVGEDSCGAQGEACRSGSAGSAWDSLERDDEV